MGMFDSVIAECRSCGGEIEFQTEAGPRRFLRYSPEEAPPQIAGGIHGHATRCSGCGKAWEAKVQSIVTIYTTEKAVSY